MSAITSSIHAVQFTRAIDAHLQCLEECAFLKWLVAGVCSAMMQIASAGYRLLFLTARPITRSEATRKYLSAIGLVSYMLLHRVVAMQTLVHHGTPPPDALGSLLKYGPSACHLRAPMVSLLLHMRMHV
jgi:hypothetical protein